MKIEQMAWLFPMLFMIHDFEEIILIKQWKRKQGYNELKIKPYKDFRSTASFSMAVAQEFILFCLVTYFSVLFNRYFIWFGMFSAVVIHFVIHGVISMGIRRYHPGLITSVLLLPAGIYLMWKSIVDLEYPALTIAASILIGVILLLVNLKILHKLMPVFERRIRAI